MPFLCIGLVTTLRCKAHMVASAVSRLPPPVCPQLARRVPNEEPKEPLSLPPLMNTNTDPFPTGHCGFHFLGGVALPARGQRCGIM